MLFVIRITLKCAKYFNSAQAANKCMSTVHCKLLDHSREIIRLASSSRPHQTANSGPVDICPAYMQQKSTYTQSVFFYIYILCKCCFGCFMLLLLRWIWSGPSNLSACNWEDAAPKFWLNFTGRLRNQTKPIMGGEEKRRSRAGRVGPRRGGAPSCVLATECRNSIKCDGRDKRPRPRLRRLF